MEYNKRQLEICEKCHFFELYKSSYPKKDGTVKKDYKYFCKIDTEGLIDTVTKKGRKISWEIVNTTLEEFVNQEPPEKCTYKMEHLILTNGKRSDSKNNM